MTYAYSSNPHTVVMQRPRPSQSDGVALPENVLTTQPETARVWMARAGEWMGTALVSSTIRSEACGALQTLHAMGLRTVVLTGEP